MYNYNKPLVVETSDLSEGVYAASGDSSGDCWTMSYSYNSSNSTTTNPGWNKAAYIISAKHGNVKHISKSTTMIITFSNDDVARVEIEGYSVYANSGTNAFNNYEVTLSTAGTTGTLTIKRIHHANAYQGGSTTDLFDINVLFYGTNGTAVINTLTWDCEHVPNVQGGID